MTLVDRQPQWLHEHLRNSLGGRAPIFGTVELTSRCNFDCSHCYMKDFDKTTCAPTEKILSVLDQAADLGCLYLVLTGGEPLIHPDFPQVLSHLVSKGIMLTVFTNASLITPELASVMANNPVRRVEVSLYGEDEKTYRLTTSRSGQFSKVIHGIELMLHEGITVKLKVPMLNTLANSIQGIRKLAMDMGLELQLDPQIDPRLNGDLAPLLLRMAPEKAVDMELQDEKARALYTKSIRDPAGSGPCGAGRTGFNIDPWGNLSPCLQVRSPSASTLDMGFAKAWQSLDSFEPPEFAFVDKCRDCSASAVCSVCPSLVRSSQDLISDEYYCDVAFARLSKLNEPSSEEVFA